MYHTKAPTPTMTIDQNLHFDCVNAINTFHVICLSGYSASIYERYPSLAKKFLPMNELAILDALPSIKTPLMDTFVAAFTWMGNIGQLWIILGIVLICIPQTRRLGVAVLIAFALGTLITSGIIKPLLMRPRPCDINPHVPLIIDRPFGSSFPSGHTTSAFASAFALLFMRHPRAPKALIIVVFVLAVFMAFTRLYCYVHYPTDVLAGILVGLLAAFLSAKIMSIYNTNHPSKETK